MQRTRHVVRPVPLIVVAVALSAALAVFILRDGGPVRWTALQPGKHNHQPIGLFVRQEGASITVFSSDAKGDLACIGRHKGELNVAGGSGGQYALWKLGPEMRPSSTGRTELALFAKGRKLYDVPSGHLIVDGRQIYPRAVLAGGRFLVTYEGNPMRMTQDERDALFAAVIYQPRAGGQVLRRRLFSGERKSTNILLSGDGSVYAIGFHPDPEAGRDKFYAQIFRSRDSKVVATLDDFMLAGISHDGTVALGDRADRPVIYREGKIFDKPPDSKCSRGVRLSSNGLYVSGIGGDFRRAAILDGRSLGTLYQVRAQGNEGSIGSHAVSPDGRLAVAFSRQNRISGIWTSVLKVYGNDGEIRWSLPPMTGEPKRGCPIRELTWSRDGQVLFYICKGNLMRKRFDGTSPASGVEHTPGTPASGPQ